MLLNYGSVHREISRIYWQNDVINCEFSLRCRKFKEISPFVQVNYCSKCHKFPLKFSQEFLTKVGKDKKRNLCISLVLLLPSTVGCFSSVTQERIRHLIKCYCNNLDVKLVFQSFKIGMNDLIPGINFCVQAVMPVTLVKPPSIFSHAYVSTQPLIGPVMFSSTCKILNNATVYVCILVSIIISDHASTSFQLKLKEAIHIRWEQPTLNQQMYHVN